MGRIFMEVIDIDPHKVIGIEIWQIFDYVGLCISEHVTHGIVHIDDVQIGICHHGIGGDIVQCLLDAGIFCC